MFCDSCSKLMVKFTQKKCLQCGGNVQKNISALCDQCSVQEKKCSACLKKIVNPATKRVRGCGSCGGKV